MKIKLIEQLKFKFTGRFVPVVRVSEVDQKDGQIRSLQIIGTCRDDPNRLIMTWDNKGWEKEQGSIPVSLISEKGNAELAWVVSERGQTVNLYTQPWKGPALENVIGRQATVDSIAEAMGLTPSMREKIIFMVIGILLGWLIFGPIINKILS